MTLVRGQDPQRLSSFVSPLESKALERSPVAPQTEFNSLASVGGCRGKGIWGLLGGPDGLQHSLCPLQRELSPRS